MCFDLKQIAFEICKEYFEKANSLETFRFDLLDVMGRRKYYLAITIIFCESP